MVQLQERLLARSYRDDTSSEPSRSHGGPRSELCRGWRAQFPPLRRLGRPVDLAVRHARGGKRGECDGREGAGAGLQVHRGSGRQFLLLWSPKRDRLALQGDL